MKAMNKNKSIITAILAILMAGTSCIKEKLELAYNNQEDRIDKYIEKNKELYGKKCKIMLDAMEKYFPEGKVKWTVPEGGLFIWGTVKDCTDASFVVKKAIENGENITLREEDLSIVGMDHSRTNNCPDCGFLLFYK